MSYIIRCGIGFALVFLMCVGCGPSQQVPVANNNQAQENQTTANANPNGNPGQPNGDQLEIGGVPNPQDNGDTTQEGEGQENQAGDGTETPQGSDGAGLGRDDAPPVRRNPSNIGIDPRRRGDNLQIGGGGNTGNIPSPEERRRMREGAQGDDLSIGGAPRGANSGRNNNRNVPADSGEAFAGGGLPNGFYPQPGGGSGEPVNVEGALANGFYPQSITGGGGAFVSAAAPVTPSIELMNKAVGAFQARNEEQAFRYLYGHVLCSDHNLEKYPIRWYEQLKAPRVAFRWGIGVIYSNKSDNSTPLVIGDPTGVRQTESSGRNRSRGGRSGSRGGANGFEAPDGGGRGPQNQSSSNSDYASVDVENPEGFLLYYTGDLGDRLLTRLDNRRKHADGFYGDVLREIVIDYSGEASQAAAPINRRPRGPIDPRQRDNLSVGGTPRGAGGPNNAGGGPGGAGHSERLKRLLTSSEASSPASDTSGTLVPGVMLVGEGTRSALIERAKNMGLDGLIIIKSSVKSGRRSTGMAGMKIIDLHSGDDGEEVYSGRTLTTDRVAEIREELTDESRDPVELALDDMFQGMADTSFKAGMLPTVLRDKPEFVARRVNSIVGSMRSNPLPAVVEIMSFYKQGLLEKDVAVTSVNRLLGGVLGQFLVDGTEEERYEILKKFLPAGANSGGSGTFR